MRIQGVLEVDWRQLEILLQHEIVEIENLTELGSEAFALEQIRDTQRTTRDLVLVSRADAAAGGTNRINATGLFTSPIERDM